MMETLLIIDGNNLLFQMFYGMPAKIYNKRGETIHATIGFISALLKQIKMTKATKVFVAFDEDCSQERIEILEDYKKNRRDDWETLPPDEVPFNEEGKIKDCLKSLGINFACSKDMEADDLIASIALSFQGEHKIIISSFDSDFFQLIGENISVLRYRNEKSVLYNIETFKEKFQFHPQKYVFYKALVGDTADNIKGIPGIGKVRATCLINQCENYEDIVLKSDKILSLKLRDNILSHRDIFYRNIELISLKQKVISSNNIHDFSFNETLHGMTNTEVLTLNKIFN